MAITVLGSSTCSICQEILMGSDDIVSTTHFIHDQYHALWRYSDSAMHRGCFLGWDAKEEFRELYNSTINKLLDNPSITHRMEANGEITIKRGA